MEPQIQAASRPLRLRSNLAHRTLDQPSLREIVTVKVDASQRTCGHESKITDPATTILLGACMDGWLDFPFLRISEDPPQELAAPNVAKPPFVDNAESCRWTVIDELGLLVNQGVISVKF